jgi:hypothetical protein
MIMLPLPAVVVRRLQVQKKEADLANEKEKKMGSKKKGEIKLYLSIIASISTCLHTV